MLIVGILVASVLFGGTIYFALLRTPLEDFHKVDITALSETQYCEVKNNPDRYNGKIVRIRAPLGYFIHGAFFEDPQCRDKYYEQLVDDGRTALSFFEPKREELFETYQEIIKKKKAFNTIPIIAVGRFEWKYPKGISDGIEDRTSFHFEAYSIELAKE
ncbi:MAG: hypothetical protein ACT4O9_01565 [Blastocatellia bacterium]